MRPHASPRALPLELSIVSSRAPRPAGHRHAVRRSMAGVGVLLLVATACSGSHHAAQAPPALTRAPSTVGAPNGAAAPSSAASTTVTPTLAPPTTVAPPAAPASAGPTAASTSPQAPPVAPLGTRITPDVFVLAPRQLSPTDVANVLAATHGTSADLVDVGAVSLGKGSTTALGIDPSTFRTFAPQGTAESTPLWQAVARGDIAVAHTVAAALAVPLGGREAVAVSGSVGETFRVGALATTGLPGVGVVVDNRYTAGLKLGHDVGLLLAAPGGDPVVTAALVQQTLGNDVQATPLRVPVSADGRLTWVPPAIGPITQGFGYHDNPLNRGHIALHPGIDIGAPYGAPIYAASAGSVVYAGPASGFGNEVILQHAGDVETVYGHMERILVAAGAPVTAGQPIALVGAEGEATGPHLHFEVHVGGQLTDPLVWLEQHGVTVTH